MLDEHTASTPIDTIEEQSIKSLFPTGANSSPKPVTEQETAPVTLERPNSSELQNDSTDGKLDPSVTTEALELGSSETSKATLKTPPTTVPLSTPEPEHKAHPSASMTSGLPDLDEKTDEETQLSLAQIVKKGKQVAKAPPTNMDDASALEGKTSPSTKSPPTKVQKQQQPQAATSKSSKHRKDKLPKVVRELSSDYGNIGSKSRFVATDGKGRPPNKLQAGRSPAPDAQSKVDEEGFVTISSSSKSPADTPPKSPSPTGTDSSATSRNKNSFSALDLQSDSEVEDSSHDSTPDDDDSSYAMQLID